MKTREKGKRESQTIEQVERRKKEKIDATVNHSAENGVKEKEKWRVSNYCAHHWRNFRNALAIFVLIFG